MEAPNYDFSLDTLSLFFPGSSLKSIKEKYGEGDMVKNGAGLITRKFYVSHIRYKFPVVVSVVDDKIVDMYAVLPSYFLHDVFHQSLINRFGKQDNYKLYNGTALYLWNNKNNMKLYYSSTCTLTCFPLYFSAVNADGNANFTPMIESLSAGHF